MKILIVDDEVIVRIGLKSLIEKDGNKYEIIGEASNGKDALNFMASNTPDIIITDIKMPVMDGLQLIRSVRNMNIQIRFIVLSGYDDFHLVKEAMKLGAVDYIIKLDMQQDLICEILASLSVEMEEKHKFADQKEETELYLKENLGALRQNFFSQLIRGHVDEKLDFEHRLELIDLNIDVTEYVCIVFELMDIGEKKNIDDEYTKLFNLSLTSIVNDIINEEFTGYTFEEDHQRIVSIVSWEDKKQKINLKELFHEMLERSMQMLIEYFDVTVSVGVSNRCNHLKELSRGYSECSIAIRHSFYRGVNQVIYFNEVGEKIVSVDHTNFQLLKGKLINGTELRDMDTIDQVIDDIVCLFQSHNVSRENTLDMCYEITYLIIDKVDDSLIDMMVGDGGVLFGEIQKLKSIFEITQWFLNLKEVLFNYLNEDTGSELGIIVQNTKKYINQHYNDQLTLKDLAAHLFISPGYLSNIFKQATGNTLTEYITKIRIYHARKLLSEGKFKVYEIAFMVGFSSSNYFCRVFKRETGASPKEILLKNVQ